MSDKIFAYLEFKVVFWQLYGKSYSVVGGTGDYSKRHVAVLKHERGKIKEISRYTFPSGVGDLTGMCLFGPFVIVCCCTSDKGGMCFIQCLVLTESRHLLMVKSGNAFCNPHPFSCVTSYGDNLILGFQVKGNVLIFNLFDFLQTESYPSCRYQDKVLPKRGSPVPELRSSDTVCGIASFGAFVGFVCAFITRQVLSLVNYGSKTSPVPFWDACIVLDGSREWTHLAASEDVDLFACTRQDPENAEGPGPQLHHISACPEMRTLGILDLPFRKVTGMAACDGYVAISDEYADVYLLCGGPLRIIRVYKSVLAGRVTLLSFTQDCESLLIGSSTGQILHLRFGDLLTGSGLHG